MSRHHKTEALMGEKQQNRRQGYQDVQPPPTFEKGGSGGTFCRGGRCTVCAVCCGMSLANHKVAIDSWEPVLTRAARFGATECTTMDQRAAHVSPGCNDWF